MEDVFFTTGTNEYPANFTESKKRLARYVGTCNYRGAATASLVIETMTNPTFTVTKRPDQPNLKAATEDKVDEANEKMLILDYSVEIAKYIKDQKETRIKERGWKENGPKLWNLVLSHCPKQVTLKLEAQPGYEDHALKRDPVRLLELLRDVAHSFSATTKTKPWRSSNRTSSST